MNTTRQAARQAEVVAALRPDVLPDPCNHCPHDNADHRGDGCLRCGCDVPQC